MQIKAKNPRVYKLSKGKIKSIGFFERFVLKIIGFLDGRRGLPRESSGTWISPHIDREVRAFDEFASRVWGQLQIDQEPVYAHLGELMDSLVHTRGLLENAELELKDASKEEITASRKAGESKLSEEQVITRRANERAKKLAPIKATISSLQEKLSAEINEFSTLRNQTIEVINSTRIICNRVKKHLGQRFDVYWNAVLQKHPDNARMPVVPCIEVVSHAESLYLEPHKVILQRAESLSDLLTDEYKEVHNEKQQKAIRV